MPKLQRGLRVRFICRGQPDQAALVLRVIQHASDLMAVELLVLQGGNPQHHKCVLHVSKKDPGAPMAWDFLNSESEFDWEAEAA